MFLMKFNLSIMEDRYCFTFPSKQGSGINFLLTFAYSLMAGFPHSRHFCVVQLCSDSGGVRGSLR